MQKKFALIFLVILVVGLIAPVVVSAKQSCYPACELKKGDDKCSVMNLWVCYEGLVPCGKEVLITQGTGANAKTDLSKDILHCQLCHVFIMISEGINYLFVTIIPPLAVLMMVIGGVMYFLSGARPDLQSRAKALFKSIAIGLALIYGAFMIVGIALTILGATKMEPVSGVWDEGRIFSIQCPIQVPENIIP